MDLDLVHFWQDCDGSGRRVNPAGGLGNGHPLDAMDAALELEPGKRALALHPKDDLFETTDAGRVAAQQLRLPPLPLGVADIHAMQIRSKEAGLVATGPGANLDNHVLGIARVLWDQQPLELDLQLIHPGLQLNDLRLGQFPQFWVGIVRKQGLRTFEFGGRILVVPVDSDDLLNLSPLFGVLGHLFVVLRHSWVSHQARQFLEPFFDFIQSCQHNLLKSTNRAAWAGRPRTGGYYSRRRGSVKKPYAPAIVQAPATPRGRRRSCENLSWAHRHPKRHGFTSQAER